MKQTSVKKLRADLARERAHTVKLEDEIFTAEYFIAEIAETRDRNLQLVNFLRAESHREKEE